MESIETDALIKQELCIDIYTNENVLEMDGISLKKEPIDDGEVATGRTTELSSLKRTVRASHRV
jgi:hypothetical protein